MVSMCHTWGTCRLCADILRPLGGSLPYDPSQIVADAISSDDIHITSGVGGWRPRFWLVLRSPGEPQATLSHWKRHINRRMAFYNFYYENPGLWARRYAVGYRF